MMNIAQGSLEECRCYVMLSKDLEYISEDEFQTNIADFKQQLRNNEVYFMLNKALK